ncbi:hypothetical protein P59_204 [Bacillus phage P59]|nr:hypothetical protein P59_204 [Bacillus phage P59]
MTIEKKIEDVIKQQLEDGTIQKVVGEQFQKSVEKAVDHLFSSYGDVTKIIEKQVKSVLVPYLENYDYSEYITKLDHVLVEVLKSTALDNKKILENFQHLMAYEQPKKIKVTEIFDKYKEYVAKDVETNGLEIDYDDTPTYEYVEVTMSVEDDESNRSWSSMEYSTVVFECEHDEELNVSFKIYRWKNESSLKGWRLDDKREHHLSSLRHLNMFEIFLMQLAQSYTEIEVDEDHAHDEVRPDAEPEPDWS